MDERNILDPAVSPKHVGQAYMEMQFYPPGWIPWPAWRVAVGASSCNPAQWCAAMNIDSLSLNPVTGKANNPTCLAKAGEEYLNFAFITKNGKSQAPANPIDATNKTFTPGSGDLFMNPGDHLKVAFTDTNSGEKVTITDTTTGQTGALVYKVTGCSYTNVGFDGASYQRLWPDGNTTMHPTPFQFSSPITGAGYTTQYAQAGFETDLPAVEGTCDTTTGAGCTLIPQADGGVPAAFYPSYTTTMKGGGGCKWQFGNDIPGEISNYGQNGQYGTLLQQSYTNVGGSSSPAFEDFRGIIPNPCPQA